MHLSISVYILCISKEWTYLYYLYMSHTTSNIHHTTSNRKIYFLEYGWGFFLHVLQSCFFYLMVLLFGPLFRFVSSLFVVLLHLQTSGMTKVEEAGDNHNKLFLMKTLFEKRNNSRKYSFLFIIHFRIMLCLYWRQLSIFQKCLSNSY